MAKRFIDTDLFRKPFMRGLEAPYKALWIYLLCECDHAGVWTVELDVAHLRMGMKLDTEKALEKMGGAVIPIDGGAKWFLPDFVAFQYGKLNPANRVHESVLAILSKYGIDPNELSQNKPLTSPLQGAKDKDKDKDSEEKERATPNPPEGFNEFWAVYPIHKAKADAVKAWGKLTDTDRALCLPAITAQLKAHHFRGKDGQDFIPYGASWLNARRWEDEVTAYAPVLTPNGSGMTKAQADEEMRQIRIKHGRDPDNGWVGDEECSRPLLIYMGRIKERKAV